MKSFGQYIVENSLSDLKEIDVSKIIMEWYPGNSLAHVRTQIYESTVCIMAKYGSSSIGSIKKALGNSEMNSKYAKPFYERYLNEYKGDVDALKGLSAWVRFLGGPILELGKMKSFIHDSIDTYYESVPATFKLPNASKQNTADCVLISDGSPRDLYNALADLKAKDEATQIKRIRPGRMGKVTIVDSGKKGIVSFYQVSLKNEGQVGKAGMFVNRQWLGGGKFSSPGEAKATFQRNEHIPDFDELLDEGLIDWAKGAASKVVASLQAFVSWASGKLQSIVSRMTGSAERYANKKIRKNKGIKAIENIFSDMGQSLNEEFLIEAEGPVKLTQGQVENFRLVYQEFVASETINQIHNINMQKVGLLNKSYKQKNREMDPIYISGDGNLNLNKWKKDLAYLGSITYDKKTKVYKDSKGKKITTVSRAQVFPMYKIAANYSANVVIEGLLRTASDSLGTYKTIGNALYAMTGNLEAEVKFGNTQLPILICYGGKTQKLVVLGTREDYSKDLTADLKAGAKKIKSDYPVLRLRYNKKDGYNVVNMKLLNSFKPAGKTVEPWFMEYGIRTNSGSSFTCTVEASKPTNKWQ